MEYSIQTLAKLSGISSRTLRYYDEIELLQPCRVTPAGYRIYGEKEVDLLQQILFYRALDVPLSEIRRIVHTPNFDRRNALRSHLAALHARQEQLSSLIHTVNKTLASMEGGTFMNDTEKFEGFKKKLIADNEAQHGKEVRAKYGDAAADAANSKLLNLTEEQYELFHTLEQEVLHELADAVRAHDDPAGDVGRRISSLHHEWLSYSWNAVTPQAHIGLAQMYLADERFTAYYDREQTGCTQFLLDAVTHWAPLL